LALRAEIAASAAHQLSQPSAAMSNYAGAAVRMHEQGRLGGDELRDLLGRIELLARQAGETLDALRGLIRHAHLPEVPVDVNQVVDFCLDFLTARVQRQAVRVERRFGHDLPKPMGEPVELSHALIQLLSNGLEAMESTLVAERRLCVATSHDPATDRILIDVGDTGRGVSPELADRLFEPWQTDKPGALGIGLSIAQTMVEKRKGVIRMFPGDNGGAVFRIELPVSGGGQT
jgi:C4-dicarboxylate-specific signal transduction histidine kinase